MSERRYAATRGRGDLVEVPLAPLLADQEGPGQRLHAALAEAGATATVAMVSGRVRGRWHWLARQVERDLARELRETQAVDPSVEMAPSAIDRWYDYSVQVLSECLVSVSGLLERLEGVSDGEVLAEAVGDYDLILLRRLADEALLLQTPDLRAQS